MAASLCKEHDYHYQCVDCLFLERAFLYSPRPCNAFQKAYQFLIPGKTLYSFLLVRILLTYTQSGLNFSLSRCINDLYPLYGSDVRMYVCMFILLSFHHSMHVCIIILPLQARLHSDPKTNINSSWEALYIPGRLSLLHMKYVYSTFQLLLTPIRWTKKYMIRYVPYISTGIEVQCTKWLDLY